MAKLEFFFDYGSAYSYLADTQVAAVAARAGAELVYRPMLLGGVFKATGNASPATLPSKGIYMLKDLHRWAARYGVPFAYNPHFPVNTLKLMRMAVAAQRLGVFPAFHAAVFRGLWVEERNLGEPAEIEALLKQAGLDAAALFAESERDEVKQALKAATDEAVERGAFGAPALFVGDELFWGNDRLDFVEAALRG